MILTWMLLGMPSIVHAFNLCLRALGFRNKVKAMSISFCIMSRMFYFPDSLNKSSLNFHTDTKVNFSKVSERVSYILCTQTLFLCDVKQNVFVPRRWLSWRKQEARTNKSVPRPSERTVQETGDGLFSTYVHRPSFWHEVRYHLAGAVIAAICSSRAPLCCFA